MESLRLHPVPFLHRPPPADCVSVYALAALLWRQGRERFRELSIGPDAFDEAEPRLIAAVLLAERDFAPAEVEILWRDDGETLPWYAALDYQGSAEWAVYMVDLFARRYAGRWLPPHLRWAADQLEAGAVRVEDAAVEIDRLLVFVRPMLLRREGGEAA